MRTLWIRPFLSLLALALWTIAAGCGAAPADEALTSRLSPIASADVAAPPRELIEELKRAVAAPPLSLGIEEQNRGTLVTGWKRYRGDWHIGRYWQERTRYRIDVSPDWDHPTGKSRVTVIAETEQRAAEGQRWDREPRVPRPKRAQAALKAILDHVSATSAVQ